MATEIKLPRLGQGMESGTIVKWLKSEGEPVEKGEPLYELDTDKVTQEVEADASGVLLKIAVAEGEVEVGKTIAVIGEQGEEVSIVGERREGFRRGRRARPAEPAVRPGVRGQSRDLSGGTTAPGSRRRRWRAGSRASAESTSRRSAERARTGGSSPRTWSARATAAPATTGAVQDIPGQVEVRQLSNVRKTIARRLTQAWEAPVFQLVVSADMTQALALVERLRELHPDERPTVTDVLTRVTAAALMRHRDVNAHFVDGEIHIHPSANVGIAVAAPQGLVVPVIRAAERLSIAEIARARAEVVQRARDNKLKQDDLEGGTFTISNLGMFGIEQFVAVLNPPQVAILAVGATRGTRRGHGRRFDAVPDDDDDADLRPPRDRRRRRRRLPAHAEAARREPGTGSVTVWYRVRDFDAGRTFYRETLGFEETFVDWQERWARLQRGEMEIAHRRGRARGGRSRARRRRGPEGRGRAPARRGRERRHRVRAARARPPARRVRPGRQPDPARPGPRRS